MGLTCWTPTGVRNRAHEVVRVVGVVLVKGNISSHILRSPRG